MPTGNGAFRIQPTDNAASQPSRVGSRGAASNSFVTEVVRLRAIDAATAVDTVRGLVSPQGSVTANRGGNSLVIVDFADNIRRVREVLRRIDADTSATRVVALKNAGAREIATALQALTGQGGGGAGAPATPSSVSIVAIASSNSVAIRGDANSVARLAAVAEDLDRRAKNGTEIKVIFLENADAEQLLPVLQQLVGQAPSPITNQQLSASNFGSSGSQQGGSNGFQPTSRPANTPAVQQDSGGGGGQQGQAAITAGGRSASVVTRFVGANAIVIAAPARGAAPARRCRASARYTARTGTGRSDRRRSVGPDRQPARCAICDRQSEGRGVRRLQFPEHGAKLADDRGCDRRAAAQSIDDDDQRTSHYDQQQQRRERQHRASGVAVDPGRKRWIWWFCGEDRRHVVRLDHQCSGRAIRPRICCRSRISSCSTIRRPTAWSVRKIPITTGQALSSNFDNAFRTTQRENVGIELTVRPQVNSSGTVKLNLRLEISSIAGPVSSDNSDLILNKREVETVQTVDDGDIAVTSGLLDDNERRTIEKIPLLGDVPIIGNLFKSKARQRTKTNLMIFIRPTIFAQRRGQPQADRTALRLSAPATGPRHAERRTVDRSAGARLSGCHPADPERTDPRKYRGSAYFGADPT